MPVCKTINNWSNYPFIVMEYQGVCDFQYVDIIKAVEIAESKLNGYKRHVNLKTTVYCKNDIIKVKFVWTPPVAGGVTIITIDINTMKIINVERLM